MSSQPKIFISAVTKELKQARHLVSQTLHFLHFDFVIQEEFGTTTGVTKKMLEEKIEPCIALIQIVGQRHGLELPGEIHPGHCMSFTEYEAHYAQQSGKKVWYLLLDDAYLPDHSNDEDEDKNTLQKAYRLRVKRSSHLYTGIKDAKDLEIAVLKMLFELDHLRPEGSRWLDKGALAAAPPSSPEVSKPLTKEDVRELMRELVAEQQQAKQSSPSSDPKAEEEAIYERLAKEHGVPVSQLRGQVAAAAKKIKEDKKEPLLERAKAAYALKDYPQSEKLALEAATLAAKLTVPDVQEQIIALRHAGRSAQAQIHYPQAMEHYRAATALTSQERDFLEWLDLQNAISWLYYLQGRYPEGLAHTQQVWQTAQQAGKDEAPAVLAAHMYYATALNTNGQAAAAEPEYRAVIQVQEREVGAEHPDTLKSRNNLALALDAQGKNAEAEQEHRAVLKVQERVLGAEHPNTLTSRMNLANALRAQGKNAEAELEHRAVLKVMERVLGAEHPDVATSCYNLALCLEDQKKLPEALAFMQRAEQVWTRAFGPDHPDTNDAKVASERIKAAIAKQKADQNPKQPNQGVK